jgi:hypothetical protein
MNKFECYDPRTRGWAVLYDGELVLDRALIMPSRKHERAHEAATNAIAAIVAAMREQNVPFRWTGERDRYILNPCEDD